MTEIETAVDLLYRTFAHYDQPATIEICPCGCTAPDATTHLTATPLRELRFESLANYSFAAMTTQGSVDDLRYLLPRLLQGMAEEPYTYNAEIFFGKLKYARWTGWPKDEVEAVRSYLQALWQSGLASFPLNEHLPAFFEIETLLASIARTGEPLEPYLQTFAEAQNIEADQHLVQFVTIYGSEFSGGRTLHEAFWSDSKAQAISLRSWLLQPDTLQRIGNAAYLLRNDGFEHLFAPALDILRIESGVK